MLAGSVGNIRDAKIKPEKEILGELTENIVYISDFGVDMMLIEGIDDWDIFEITIGMCRKLTGNPIAPFFKTSNLNIALLHQYEDLCRDFGIELMGFELTPGALPHLTASNRLLIFLSTTKVLYPMKRILNKFASCPRLLWQAGNMSRAGYAMTKESAPPYSIFLTDEDLNFPDVSLYRGDTPIAYGYGISTEQILRAYNLGIFPWPNSKGLVFWMSPDPRAVIFPDKFRISRSLKKTIQREVFTHQIDTDFLSVIHYCAAVPRPGQNGTWINRDIIKAYTALHQIGRVHSLKLIRTVSLPAGFMGYVSVTFLSVNLCSVWYRKHLNTRWQFWSVSAGNIR
ncbi:hypothetical protein CHS0354_006904 [Potamilus streckersoni]|uniref:Uncharacterized protein n=1 Tax=Potamilus streckersoni TaxID=2493646 RepID=A0AAE0WB69_9BIVA|nr:hypothetical protein CHS0354_006904 [Potamilus streckersoni]